MSKILIVYASFGQGHKKAAQALTEHFDSSCCDLLDFSHPVLKKIYSLAYLVTTQYLPCLWNFAFFLTKINFFSSLLNKRHKKIFASFFSFLRKEKPRIIIATHFFPPMLIENIKSELNIKLISVITDLRVHPLWINRCVDYYLCALEETKNDLLKAGIRGEQIITGYVPLRKGFLAAFSRENFSRRFYLGTKPSILFVSSSRGRFPFFKEVVKVLLEKFNIFVIYGRNRRLKLYLEGIDSPSLRYFPFYEEMWELISVSSVIIAKPGGLTVFEGIYKKRPFIFTHYIPGQEKANMDLLIKYGVAKFARSKQELIEAIYHLADKGKDFEEHYPLEVKDASFVLKSLIQKIDNV
ncbi:MAG: hypothetical protein NG737_01135 [Omnitrophica bacterium]|nr:hypothetical protein [Candidatus Omnitrophota bacterium]